MDWLNRKNEFSDQDLKLLQFCPDHLSTCAIETIKLSKGDNGNSVLEPQSHRSETEFCNWVERACPAGGSPGPRVPTIVLVIFPRLGETSSMANVYMPAMSLPCAKETWRKVAKRMFQHRSVPLLSRGLSTAIIQSRFVTWQDSASSWGKSIVYGCTSDTVSPTKKWDDVVLSVTSFIDVPLTFAIMYGCTQRTKTVVNAFLKQIKATGQAWHPLLLPMLFAELERKRLLSLLEGENTKLQQRILEMENRLRGETADTTASMETNANEPSAATKDCEATKSWIDASKLKNGLESLKTQLTIMMAHSKMLRQSVFALHPGEPDSLVSECATGEIIESRLNDMIVEFDCKIRSYGSLLGGMGMAAQMEWNYYTRRDSRANIIIANATKRDGSQMRMISLLGMTFLPGTFLATMFSMGFFNWGPGDDHMISPWITLYLGLTAVLTTLTLWRWKRWTAAEDQNTLSQLKKVLDSDSDSVWMDAGEKV